MLPKNRCPTHPGIILLKHFLQPMGLSQADLVCHFAGSWTRAKLNEIIRGKRGVSLEVALDLADALGTSAEFWINLQINHDLWKTMQHHKKIQRIDFTPRDSEELDCQDSIGTRAQN